MSRAMAASTTQPPGRVSGRPNINSDEYRRRLSANLRNEWERRRRAGAADRGGPVSQGIETEVVEFYPRENAKEHHTNMYDLVDNPEPAVILRRGQPFYVAIRFKRPYDPQRDDVKVHFKFGPGPHLVSKGNLVFLPVTTNNSFTKPNDLWDVRTHHHNGAIVTLHVQVPASVAVGVWQVSIYSTSKAEAQVPPHIYKCRENIYILFNPWCKEDTVYMENEQWKQEYILNDVGKIFYGTKNQPKGRRWIYGQFADVVLPASVLVLETSKLDATGRASPVTVVRAISKLVNSMDDTGVLVGNWSGNYEDGVAPYMWTGSAAILEKYMESNGEESVKYGQCWVFAGVVTTVCRALGIPCRTVTNFVSAHDTDRSLTIDRYFDEANEEIEGMSGDSIWNFHVWNDCWMARPDLPSGYGGWQAIDSTPQETSGDIFQMGPASVEAIRRGEIGHQFDCPFVFAEVNADIVHWKVDEHVDGGLVKMKSEKYSVGPFILTKKVGLDDDTGDKDAENIVEEYKNKEGTMEERLAVLNAARVGGNSTTRSAIYNLPTPEAEDVFFDLLEIDKIMIGQPFSVTVKVQNLSDQPRNISAVLSASTVYYTGILARKVKRQRGTFALKPKQTEQLSITVNAEEYYDKLVDYSMIKIYAVATVKETQQTWAEEDDFAVEKPTLQLQIPEGLKVGVPFDVKVSFVNPLKRVLTDCVFTMEGPGLTDPMKARFRDIQPEESVTHFVRFTPLRPGPRKLLVNLSSRQLVEILGSKQLNISP